MSELELPTTPEAIKELYEKALKLESKCMAYEGAFGIVFAVISVLSGNNGGSVVNGALEKMKTSFEELTPPSDMSKDMFQRIRDNYRETLEQFKIRDQSAP